MRSSSRRLRRRYVTVVVLLVAAFATAVARGLKRSGRRGPAPTRGTVRRVIDGDTFDLTNGARIRLLDIDAPEFGGSESGRASAQRATDALVEFLGGGRTGRVVRLGYGPRVKDRHGRFLAYVFVEEGDKAPAFVNLELVRRGLARAYVGGGHGSRYDEILAREREARTAGRGIWAGAGLFQ